MSSKKEHYLMRDNIAKKIFKNPTIGKELTARIVGELLHKDYRIIYNDLTPGFTEIANNVKTVDNEADIIYNTSGNVINIEINYLFGPHRNAQMNAYVCQLYIGQIKSSKNYNDAKGIIQILIEDYDYYKKGEFVYEVVLMEKKYKLEDDSFFRRYHISLEYLEKLRYNEIKEELEKLTYFLIGYDEEKREKVYGDDGFMKDVIRNAYEIAGKEKQSLFMSNDEITRLDQEYHQKVGYQKGMQEGIEKGISKGIEQGSKEARDLMIQNMNKYNVPIDTIAKSANLSLEEVKEILRNC